MFVGTCLVEEGKGGGSKKERGVQEKVCEREIRAAGRQLRKNSFDYLRRSLPNDCSLNITSLN